MMVDNRSGWWYTYPSEKYELVNGKDSPVYEMENKKWLKPPSSENILENKQINKS